MRNVIRFNQNWIFVKNTSVPTATLPQTGETVDLPHTWNATDGQDGGNDYFRGSCSYTKALNRADFPEGDQIWLEFRGANSSADVYLNGEHLAHHDGGYSTWRVNLTDGLRDRNVICVLVDNAPNDRVYPQVADFTFYGGLYRDVNLIGVPDTHFDLSYYGSPGIAVTPTVEKGNGSVEIQTYVTGQKNGDVIVYSFFDREGTLLSESQTPSTHIRFESEEQVHLWNGRKDPYLYTAKAKIVRDGKVLDEISARFGFRTFEIDPERGFILNGTEYPLRGVSRHQDRLGIGNALLPEHHKEDMDLICEVGATTIRLAHYQHDPYFYDLCDERGLVVWAEIPYISQHMPTGRENTVSQMKELILQNYNHPSIAVWGLSNEITMSGATDPDLIENHKLLNDLAHQTDPTRRTAVACLSMCNIDEEYVHISDVVSYNHYFGWYGGNTDMNGPWLDDFHRKYPDKPIGVSEYGCEGLNWHTSKPRQGDYTEEYQAYYHEELIKQLFTRPYLWATHVWNMFDFGADARAEGGENGQNHKGLVTMDRTYKKDAFYAYKAWLSDEPFVHLCGKRYVDRVEEKTRITVYSNLPEVELFANGKSVGKKKADDHFFYFTVKNEGETTLKAVAGDYTDQGVIRKVSEPNPDYILKEKSAVLNWFDITEPEGHFSLNDTVEEILATEEGRAWFAGFGAKLTAGAKPGTGFPVSDGMMKMLGGFTVLRLTGLVGMMNVEFTKEELLEMNRQLNNIRKPEKH